MNNQFATQFLFEDIEDIEANDLLASLQPIIDKALAANMTPEEIHAIIHKALGLDEMTGSGAVGGTTTTVGGGTTDGASWDSQGPAGTGTGEQHTGRKRKFEENADSKCVPVEELEAILKAYKIERDDLLRKLVAKYGGTVSEDAEPLAAMKSKTNSQGAKNLSAYSSVGFTKAPSAKEAGKDIKGVQVKMLWNEVEGKKTIAPEAVQIIKDFTNRNIDPQLRKDFYQEVLEDLKSDKLSSESTINSLKRFLRDKAAFFGERYTENLNESRAYSKFKKEAATRTKDQQMHEAVKIIHEKLEEVSRLAEFAQQMRNELSEGETNLEYKHNTKKVFEKINKKVVEVYSKTKKLG